MDQTRLYNKALMEVKDNIKQLPNALEDIKFCCGNIDGFSASELENMTTPLHLYKKLEQLDMLNQNNVRELKDLLATVNLVTCVRILERYENGAHIQPVQQPHSQSQGLSNNSHPPIPHNIRFSAGPTMQTNPAEDLSGAFDIIVENIGRDWRRLARRLPGRKITETEIEELTDRHIRDLREQSRGALNLWQLKNPQEANKSVLIDALRQCEMNYIADIVEGLISR